MWPVASLTAIPMGRSSMPGPLPGLPVPYCTPATTSFVATFHTTTRSFCVSVTHAVRSDWRIAIDRGHVNWDGPVPAEPRLATNVQFGRMTWSRLNFVSVVHRSPVASSISRSRGQLYCPLPEPRVPQRLAIVPF